MALILLMPEMITIPAFNKLWQHCFTVDVRAYLHLISTDLAREWYREHVRMLLLKIYNRPP